MLKDRLIVGISGAILAILLILFGGKCLFGVVVSAIAVIGLTEMYNALGVFKSNKSLAVIGYVAAAALLLCSYMGNAEKTFQMFVCVYMLMLLVYMVICHKVTSFSDISVNLFSTMYVTLFFAYLILIRNSENGKLLIWMPIIIAWLSDTMAYTFGRLFGKHKLIPTVSPKKTIEGALGGVIGGVLFMTVYGIVCMQGFDKTINWIALTVLAVIGTILSQLGDLAASWIKREHNIKDYGSLMPGHGGVMDRFDSVLVVAPFVYYFIQIFPVF